MTTKTVTHTPGPWRIVAAAYDNGAMDIRGPLNADKSSDYIATLSGCDETEGNGKLIAAAPELLAELERATAIVKHYLRMDRGMLLTAEDVAQLMRGADSAIQKARGL